MLIYRHASSLPAAARGAVVALGNFDGVHLGHQAVIGSAGEIARASAVPQAVLSFEPHPRSFFQPSAPPFRLTPFRAKAELLRRLGVDLLYSLRFDSALAQRSADSFVRDILAAGLGIRHAVVGYDFVFGNGRRGHAAMLEAMGRELGFSVTVVAPAQTGTEIYSSTRIRSLLGEGKPRQAAILLGRPWEIDGRVEHGDQRGQTIGFPTANLLLDGYLRPALGVYAVRAGVGRDGPWHDAVANFGMRPTVGGTAPRLEVHLFDFDGDLYGRHLRVALVDFIRAERKFAGLEALKVQIAADCATARAILADERTG